MLHRNIQVEAKGGCLHRKTISLHKMGGVMDMSITRYGTDPSVFSGSFTDASMIELRDALIEAYPTATARGTVLKRPKPAREDQTYLGNGKHNWEPVVGGIARLRVPGGWLYKSEKASFKAGTFVPMPAVVKHKV